MVLAAMIQNKVSNRISTQKPKFPRVSPRPVGYTRRATPRRTVVCKSLDDPVFDSFDRYFDQYIDEYFYICYPPSETTDCTRLDQDSVLDTMTQHLRDAISKAMTCHIEHDDGDVCGELWDEVEDLTRALNSYTERYIDPDSLKSFCLANPDAPECRIFDL